METTLTHDTHLFSAMVNLLVTSGRGNKDYGFNKNRLQTRYEEVASVLNQEGYRNRAGKPLNRNALKQVVHRMKKKPEVLDTFRPDWFDFQLTEVTETSHTDACLVCGTGGAVRPVHSSVEVSIRNIRMHPVILSFRQSFFRSDTRNNLLKNLMI